MAMVMFTLLSGTPALASLDAPGKREILPYLERLRDEVRLPIVYVSDAIEEVTRLADHVAVFDAGRVVAVGTPGESVHRLGLAVDRQVFLLVKSVSFDRETVSRAPDIKDRE